MLMKPPFMVVHAAKTQSHRHVSYKLSSRLIIMNMLRICVCVCLHMCCVALRCVALRTHSYQLARGEVRQL